MNDSNYKQEHPEELVPDPHEKVEHRTEYKQNTMNTRGFFGTVFILIIIVGLVAAFRPFAGSNFPPIDSRKWQAMFLNNNQVYFGHLRNLNASYVAMDNIFYLRFNQPLQQGEEVPLSALSLVKLGGELHGPEDRMYVPKSNILFWENLKDDSQVVQSISNFLAQQPAQ